MLERQSLWHMCDHAILQNLESLRGVLKLSATAGTIKEGGWGLAYSEEERDHQSRSARPSLFKPLLCLVDLGRSDAQMVNIECVLLSNYHQNTGLFWGHLGRRIRNADEANTCSFVTQRRLFGLDLGPKSMTEALPSVGAEGCR